MKKILMITHQLSYTGAPLVLLDVMRTYLRVGCRIDMVSLADGALRKEVEVMGVSITIQDQIFAERENFAAQAVDYDLVWVNTLIGYQAIYAMMLTKTPTIWWIHEGEQYFECFQTVIPKFDKLPEHIHPYAVSGYVQAVIRERYGCTVPILPAQVRDVPAQSEPGRQDVVRFLLAGTQSVLKGQDIFAEAVRLLPENYLSRAEFYLCGNEAEVDEKIHAAVESLEQDYVNVHNLHQLPREETLAQMERVDCLLAPSRVDPLPTVAVEMFMKSRPCIVSDICGVAAHITDGENGFIIPTENGKALADKICEVIDHKDALAEIGARARKIYEEIYAPGVVEQTLLRFLGRKGRLVLFVGVYDKLDIFMYELDRAFREMGYETLLFDSSDMGNSLKAFSEFLKEPVKAAVTFNNLGFLMELKEGINVWEQLGIPCINILMDHPFCYHDAMVHAPKNGIVVCPDRNHMKYVTRFYPQIPVVGFLPHGGKEPEGMRRPIAERRIDVIYAGNLSKSFAKNIMPDLTEFPFDAKEICEKTYARVVANPSMTTEEGLEQTLVDAGIVFSDERLREVIAKLHFVDLHIVSYYREKTLRVLAEAGVELAIYGAGWEDCTWIGLPNVHYMGMVSAYEVVERMRDAKIVLSTMTWFKDGTHDRVFNGMLCGAVAVSDTSLYMEETFRGTDEIPDGEKDMLLFRLEELEALPKKVKRLLANNALAQGIADRGYEKAKAGHSWDARAKELSDDLLDTLG